MTTYENAKIGDIVEVPGIGKVMLSNHPDNKIENGRIYWEIPGFRWIKSKEKFSGTARLYCFNLELT